MTHACYHARQPPLVTGISPNQGTPGTKVTLRGENLGASHTDLIGLSICGHSCLLTAEWMSASKIVCYTGPAKDDKGEIVVTTRSGGRGTSTVFFISLRQEKIGILDQSAVWVDEMNCFDNMRMDHIKGRLPLGPIPSNLLGIKADKAKISQEDMEMSFPGMNGDLTSENFSATRYLMENHPGTNFEHLQMAASNLKKQPTKKNEVSLASLKEGLSIFFEAQDALAAIHQRLECDRRETVEGSITDDLEDVLNRVSDAADSLFHEVLQQKHKADSIRNTLNVLQRFKFVFNLPRNIECNIQKGDYDVAINNYEKAKYLYGHTQVPIFKKVYEEVEDRINALRNLLFEKLLQAPSTLNDQKRYIRYLIHLDTPGDPAWQCICAQHKQILQLMQNCRDMFISDQGMGVGVTSPEGDACPFSLTRIGHTVSLNREGNLHLPQLSTPRPNTCCFEPPQQVKFVEVLSDIVISQLTNFRRLWISYVKGILFTETREKSNRQRQNDLTKMAEELACQLVKLVRGAILPTTVAQEELSFYGGWENKNKLSGQWLTQTIHTVRGCCEALSTLELPNDVLQAIQGLLLDLKVQCLVVTLQYATVDVKRLAEKEDWDVGNEGITSLPAQFEQYMVQMLQSLKEPMKTKPGEINVLLLEMAQCQASELCVDIMKVFMNCLGKLSTRKVENIGTCHKSVDLAFPNLVRSVQEEFTPTEEQRLLIILSNCQYLRSHTFLGLSNHFDRSGLTGSEKITQGSVKMLREMDAKLFDTYIKRRANPIIDSLEPGIYANNFNWADCQTTADVRNYMKEVLVNIIKVHAEVSTVSNELVPRVLSKLVELVAQEMSRLMRRVPTFSNNGALLARLELCVLRDAVASYLNAESNGSFKMALEDLPRLHSRADKKTLKQLLKKFENSSMQLQLTCLRSSIQPIKR